MRAPAEKDSDWSPPAENIKQAADLIAPAPERRAECEERVITALWLLHLAEMYETILLSPAGYRDRFRKFAQALRAVEKTGHNLVPDSFMEEVRRQRETYETLAARTFVRANSAKPRDNVKEIAVIAAHGLLTGVGAPPGVTRRGPWHKLAAILAGKDADESIFDYMKRERRRQRDQISSR
jgi:hypothetical protein